MYGTPGGIVEILGGAVRYCVLAINAGPFVREISSLSRERIQPAWPWLQSILWPQEPALLFLHAPDQRVPFALRASRRAGAGRRNRRKLARQSLKTPLLPLEEIA